MHSSSYSYRSSDSVFSNTTSTRTSLDSNENFLSVHCGPTLINSCISFGNESFDGHRYGVIGVELCFFFWWAAFFRDGQLYDFRGRGFILSRSFF